jgi:hypothetical protein
MDRTEVMKKSYSYPSTQKRLINSGAMGFSRVVGKEILCPLPSVIILVLIVVLIRQWVEISWLFIAGLAALGLMRDLIQKVLHHVLDLLEKGIRGSNETDEAGSDQKKRGRLRGPGPRPTPATNSQI